MAEQLDLTVVVAHEATMAEAEAEREAAIERQCVEEVFGLTGGELNDKPWEPFALKDAWDGSDFVTDGCAERQSFRYSYDGAPEYAARELARTHDYDDFVTVVRDIMFGGPPEVMYEKGYRYEKVVTYTTSGEAECPCAHMREEGEDVEDPCPLCETSAEDDSHYIYLGDGWAEVVYCMTRVCEECGGDFADLPREYDIYASDERCTACEPFDFDVTSYGSDVETLYRGPDRAVAESTYDLACAARPTEDVYLSLDGGVVREREVK